jgi:hypothetical protein
MLDVRVALDNQTDSIGRRVVRPAFEVLATYGC